MASLHARKGPSMIRDEDGLLTGYVYLDPGAEDVSRYRERMSAALALRVEVPEGFTITWSGQYEAAQRLRQRLLLIVPLTIAMIVLLIRVNTQSWVKTGIVMLAVPFSLVGALWTLYLLGFHMSTAVWVGMIALMGVDAQTGVFMLLYLDLAWEKARRKGSIRGLEDLRRVILDGAAMRIRPKVMTATTIMIGLLPIFWSTESWLGPHEANRRSDSRRNDFVIRIGVAPLSGALFDVAATTDPEWTRYLGATWTHDNCHGSDFSNNQTAPARWQ